MQLRYSALIYRGLNRDEVSQLRDDLELVERQGSNYEPQCHCRRRPKVIVL